MPAAKTIKRNTKKTNQQVKRRPAACMAIQDQQTANGENRAIVTLTDSRTDRNKNNYLKQFRSHLPDGVNKMIDGLACHQKAQVVNNLVQKLDGGGYKFNLEHPIVEDFLCATAVYQPLTI